MYGNRLTILCYVTAPTELQIQNVFKIGRFLHVLLCSVVSSRQLKQKICTYYIYRYMFQNKYHVLQCYIQYTSSRY